MDFPQIFTFYSFKVGVGRSMAVLNAAYALAAKGGMSWSWTWIWKHLG